MIVNAKIPVPPCTVNDTITERNCTVLILANEYDSLHFVRPCVGFVINILVFSIQQ